MENQLKECNTLFAAVISGGSHEDKYENYIFASIDEDSVLEWVNRFNYIVEENRGRLKNNSSNKYDNSYYFWEDFVVWDNPFAIIRKIQFR